jgi:hypothetical protein
MESRCGGSGPDVVILLDDFAGIERKSYFRVMRSQKEAWFLARLDDPDAGGGPDLIRSHNTLAPQSGLHGVMKGTPPRCLPLKYPLASTGRTRSGASVCLDRPIAGDILQSGFSNVPEGGPSQVVKSSARSFRFQIRARGGNAPALEPWEGLAFLALDHHRPQNADPGQPRRSSQGRAREYGKDRRSEAPKHAPAVVRNSLPQTSHAAEQP